MGCKTCGMNYEVIPGAAYCVSCGAELNNTGIERLPITVPESIPARDYQRKPRAWAGKTSVFFPLGCIAMLASLWMLSRATGGFHPIAILLGSQMQITFISPLVGIVLGITGIVRYKRHHLISELRWGTAGIIMNVIGIVSLFVLLMRAMSSL